MATQTEARVVYAAGAVQGIVLVTFPAASTIFTDPDRVRPVEHPVRGPVPAAGGDRHHGVAARAASSGGASGPNACTWPGSAPASSRWCCCIVSQFFESTTAVAFPLLLVATAFLGVGFGLTVPALNTLTAAFHPHRVDSSVLVLNALLGLGTALAPVFVAIFVGLGFWWGLPVMSAVLLVGLVARQSSASRCASHGGRRPPRRQPRTGIPAPLLGVRRLRGALRHLRDGERQLVAARHDPRARRLDDGRRARADRVLGDGHGRADRRWPRSSAGFRRG